MAALLVQLLKEAGVRNGDPIAVGASGSFPGLILATLSASKAMELRPFIIYSLGTSQWGANHPEFHWLRMERCLREAGLFDFSPIALSLGGEKDIGEDWPAELRWQLETEIDRNGVFLLKESELRRNVEARLKLYQAAVKSERLRAFINIGGAWANLGESHQILKWKPGLVRTQALPDQGKRGVAYEMMALEIPVIHLLYVKGLVNRYGLPWDPVPLPEPGNGFGRRATVAFPLVAALYFSLVLLTLLFRERLQ
jgi:poly-gamma-glutamate system protein